jgi:hypothetical protein
MIPQYLMISLMAINLLLSAHLHGKEKSSRFHNFWTSLTALIIQCLILYYGGFFDKFNN